MRECSQVAELNKIKSYEKPATAGFSFTTSLKALHRKVYKSPVLHMVAFDIGFCYSVGTNAFGLALLLQGEKEKAV